MTLVDQPGRSVTTKADPGIGYKIGIQADYELSKLVLAFSPGYVFEQSTQDIGWLLSDGSSAPDHLRIQYSFSWLDLPLTINYSFYRKDGFACYAGVGMTFRYLLNSGEKSDVTLGNGFTVSGTTDMAKYDWMFSPTFQVGAYWYLSETSKLDLKIGYQRSITRLYQKPQPVAGYNLRLSDFDNRQNSLSLSLAYTVPLKHLH